MVQSIKLDNGRLMPQLAIGTAFVDDSQVIERAITAAFNVGYWHVDADQAFTGIGGIHSAMSAANLDRNQIFITGKLSNEVVDHYGVSEATDRLLDSLETSYVDVLLMRNMGSATKNREAWQIMISILKTGQAQAIGVVDFNQDDLKELMNSTEIMPMIDQYMIRIGNTPLSLLNFCREHKIAIETYSPVMHGLLLRAPIVEQLAKKYQVSVNQLCIRYIVQQGLAVWRQTTKIDHLCTKFNRRKIC